MIEFTVPGQPVAQSRPRFARRGNFVATYDAAPSKDYKSWVRSCAVDYMSTMKKEMFPADTPLCLNVRINLQKPKSAKRDAFPTKKPDCDNVLKGIQDALESICYQRDQAIIGVTVTKNYTTTQPGVEISIWEYKL